MVLHNDKWAKKAKRAVERRKGVVKANGRGQAETNSSNLQRLDMGRDLEDSSDASDVSAAAESEGDSFEFDSGDEGKFVEKRSREAIASQSNAESRGTAPDLNYRTAKAKTELSADSKTSTASSSLDAHVQRRSDRKFARRRLVDNSSRYEEPVLDPYLQPTVTVPEPDYAGLPSREFTNPHEVELVPDAEIARKKPQIMKDTEHFDRLRQLQQKVEYAREMKQRFGQRAGFERQRNGEVRDDSSENDDAFFASIANGNDHVEPPLAPEDDKTTHSVTKLSNGDAHEPLEKFLDDLLKL